MSKQYLPKDPITVTVTAVSTAFQLVNNTSGPKEYSFIATNLVHVRRGYADVSAATANDFQIRTTHVSFWLMPGEGVRVIRATTDCVLQIGDTSL